MFESEPSPDPSIELELGAQDVLGDFVPQRREFAAGDLLIDGARHTPGLIVIYAGVAASSARLGSGARQMLELHFAGDWVTTFSRCPGAPPPQMTALTPLSAALVSTPTVEAIFSEHPRLAELLFLSEREARAALLDRLAGLGRATSRSRLARLLVRFHDRLEATGASDRRLPVSQVELSQLVGLSRIHTQRAIRAFIADGLIQWRRKAVEILDPDRLADVAELKPDARLAAPRRTTRLLQVN